MGNEQKDPLTETLSKGSGWQLDMVYYPSGIFVELIEDDGKHPKHIAYSERLDNYLRIATALKKKGRFGS